MRVENVQSGQNFGMAFKLKGDGAKKLAEKFHSYSDPSIAEESFVKKFVKPVEKFKSEVIYDGKDVFVKDHETSDIYKVMDEVKPVVDGSSAYYSVRNKVNNDLLFRVEYFDAGKVPEILAENAVEKKLKYAMEIIKEMGRKEKKYETKEETAGRLAKLYS